METKLSKLKPNQSGKVKYLNCSGNIKKRIAALGIIPGTKISLVRSAPLKDPIQIKIRGYYLTLRKSEAEKIILEKS